MSYTERNSNVKFVNLFRFGITFRSGLTIYSGHWSQQEDFVLFKYAIFTQSIKWLTGVQLAKTNKRLSGIQQKGEKRDIHFTLSNGCFTPDQHFIAIIP
jgi:hypothetical protein